jgi:hypothetical protein
MEGEDQGVRSGGATFLWHDDDRMPPRPATWNISGGSSGDPLQPHEGSIATAFGQPPNRRYRTQPGRGRCGAGRRGPRVDDSLVVTPDAARRRGRRQRRGLSFGCCRCRLGSRSVWDPALLAKGQTIVRGEIHLLCKPLPGRTVSRTQDSYETSGTQVRALYDLAALMPAAEDVTQHPTGSILPAPGFHQRTF